MRKRTLISIVLAIALCTLAASAGMMGSGGLTFKESPVLANLAGVHIKIVLLNSKELEKYNPIFTQQHLRTKVESILRKRHIRLLSEDELPSVPGKPVLEIRLQSGIDKQFSVVMSTVIVRLIEDVSLARDINMGTRATTFIRSAGMLANFEELEVVGEKIEKGITTFCDLYDKANRRSVIETKDKVKDSKENPKKNSTE